MSNSITDSNKRGIDVLHDPRINKSTGYTEAERQALGLVGLVPDVTESIDTQLTRVLLQLNSKNTDLDRFIYLMGLLDANETLFYRTLMSDPARFLEIVYDPTIAEACLKFDHIFRRPRGMYLSITRKGHVKEVLRNWPVKDVRFICVTDAGRILGLGDLGANGMGIPIGKLQLYTAAAGVPPEGLLPMYLDAGTNNETYLRDPFYVGLRQHRPPTEELYAFVDEFVDAVQEVFPNCCIHFEDWTGSDAIALLARYRNKVSCYNDDIQGTGGVTLAGLINALKIAGGQLKEQRVLFLGAGSAAIGLADLIVSGMGQQGLAPDMARQQIRMFDTQGLVVAGRPGLAPHKLPYAHKLPPSKPFDHLDLASECHKSSRPSRTSSRPSSSASAPWANCSRGRSSRRCRASTRGQSSLPFPTRSINTNVCPSRPTPGPEARRSTPAACNSRRFISTGKPSCLHRPTTCISSPPSAWPFTPRTRSARQTKCSLKPHMPWPIR
jgi:malate dehydrogenase (oxaloacetate-decarboxylating)(NADP+)